MSQSPLEIPSTAHDAMDVLRERVHQKRVELQAHVRSIERRIARCNNISTVCSALATVLSVGGVTVGQVFGPLDGTVWKSFAVLAAICSAISVFGLNIVRSSVSSGFIEKAHRVDMKLETLELQLDFKQISPAQGVELYAQVLADMPMPSIPKLPLAELTSSSGAPPDSPSSAKASAH